MCGILAIYHPGRTIDQSLFSRSLDSVSHRGPDDQGVVHSEDMSLGFRRLSIQDLSSAGHQPMTDPSGHVTIVFNGQIYNHRDFRGELERDGYRFRSTGDTETILALYIKKGPECFALLRGMWAILIWDARKKQLIVSRDRLGIKPLYMCERDGSIVFASEIKALLTQTGANSLPNDWVVVKYITRGWTDDIPETMFQGINSFPKATTRVYSGGKTERDISFWSQPTPSRELFDPRTLRDSLIDATQKHLLSDAPIASTLSGGIDSTAIVCIVANELGLRKSIKTFTVLADDISDESPWVEVTKSQTGVEHEYIRVQGIDYRQALDELIMFHDEPTSTVGQVNQYIFRKEVARQGFKVLLVGEGADEICAGYAKMIPMYVHSLLAARECGRARTVMKNCLDLTGNTLEKQLQRQRVFHKSRLGARTVQEYRFGYSLFADQNTIDDSRLFPPVIYPQIKASNPASSFYVELLDRLRVDIPQLLRNEDRNGMAYGLEVRPVYLDHLFFETAWRYPFEMFMAGGRNKAILRSALSGIIPDEVLNNRRKFVRPGSARSLVYKTIRKEVADCIHVALATRPGLWRGDLLQLFARDATSENANNAVVWFRFYMLQRWLALKTDSDVGVRGAGNGR